MLIPNTYFDLIFFIHTHCIIYPNICCKFRFSAKNTAWSAYKNTHVFMSPNTSLVSKYSLHKQILGLFPAQSWTISQVFYLFYCILQPTFNILFKCNVLSFKPIQFTLYLNKSTFFSFSLFPYFALWKYVKCGILNIYQPFPQAYSIHQSP